MIMNKFIDKVAVITGAASGIGRSIAIKFALEGMKVVLATPVIRQSYQRIPDIGLGYLATGIRKKDHVLIGEVAFFNYNPLNRSMELGILINPEERQNGYGREALHVLCRYLFKYRGLNKVYAQTAAHNKGAVRLVESSGFKQDGMLRDHYFFNGQFYAGLIYSLLLFEFE